MKQFADKDELKTIFMELTSVNRDYILAVARALTFAQSNAENAARLTQSKDDKAKGGEICRNTGRKRC